MTLGQYLDKPSGVKLSLFEVWTFNVSPKDRFFTFLSSDPESAKKMTNAQDQDIFVSHMHSLYQTVASSHFPLQNMA